MLVDSPTVRAGIISPAGVKICAADCLSLPTRSSRCRSTPPCEESRPRAHWRWSVAVQLSVLGLYLSASVQIAPSLSAPDDHLAAGPDCGVRVIGHSGALVVLVAVQVSVFGLYLPPVLKKQLLLHPPQTIISLPVHTAVCHSRAVGALVALVAIQRIGDWIVSPACILVARLPILRPRRSFHCQSRLPCERFVRQARWWCWWQSNYR